LKGQIGNKKKKKDCKKNLSNRKREKKQRRTPKKNTKIKGGEKGHKFGARKTPAIRVHSGRKRKRQAPVNASDAKKKRHQVKKRVNLEPVNGGEVE